MGRVVIGLAAAAFLLGGCSGSDGDQAGSGATPGSSAPAEKITFGEACARFQVALNTELSPGPGSTADEMRGLADEVERQVVQPLPSDDRLPFSTVVAVSKEHARLQDADGDILDIEGRWIDSVQAIGDLCEQVGSPLD